MPTKREIEAAMRDTEKFFLEPVFRRKVVSAALEAAERERWQPIETAPKDGSPVLIATAADADGSVIARWFKYNGTAAFRDWDNEPHFPTSWMSLPAAPAAVSSAHKPQHRTAE